MNEVFKALCADWQLRNGETNDHSDAAYDDGCIKRLGALDDEAQPICHSFGRGRQAVRRLRGPAHRQPHGARVRRSSACSPA